MPRIRRDRLRRIAAAGAGAAALATVLAACSKPTPDVTVQSGSTSTVVKPQTYCFDQQHCRIDSGSLATLKVIAGGTVLVDVPRDVETKGWQARSLVSVGTNKFKPVGGALTSSQGIVHGSHSVRLHVPEGLGSYYLVVTQQSGHEIGSWITRVTVQR